MARRGFTMLEMLLVIAFFGIAIAVASVPLTSLLYRTSLTDARTVLVDTLRRAEAQALSGYQSADWSVHLSHSDSACVFPATGFYLFRTGTFDAASGTTEVFQLTEGAVISDVSVSGGGCDVTFSRFDGFTTDVGSVTISSLDGATNTITINQYGRISY